MARSEISAADASRYFVADLEAAEEIVLINGGCKLQDGVGHRIYADPLGHPLCLYVDPSSRTNVSEQWRSAVETAGLCYVEDAYIGDVAREVAILRWM